MRYKEAEAASYLALASEAAAKVRGTTSPNPPVGAVIVDMHGRVVGVGATQPPGGPHAEIEALRQAGSHAKGGSAFVTLEPCNHQGRTGPCSEALLQAGVAEVYFVNADPNAEASGGAEFLRQHDLAVTQVPAPTPELAPWLTALKHGRPCVTLKFAQSLDGFVAAADGTSQWITGSVAREYVHLDRQHRDAIIIGTGTALADNPSLTARFPDGTLRENQPRAVVIGRRPIADSCPNLVTRGYSQYPDLASALTQLWQIGCRDVLIEGGPTLASAALRAELVDKVQAYVAPCILGAGKPTAAGLGVSTLSDAIRGSYTTTTQLGTDVLIEFSLSAS